MEALGFLSKPPKTLTAWLRVVVNFAIGLALCLLSLMDLTDNGANFMSSAWVLPTLCLSLGLGESIGYNMAGVTS